MLAVWLWRRPECNVIISAFRRPERHRLGTALLPLLRTPRVSVLVNTQELEDIWAATGLHVHAIDLSVTAPAQLPTKESCREFLGLPKDAKIIGILGAISVAKGFVELLQALPFLPINTLVFIAGPPAFNRHDDPRIIAAALNCTDRVIVKARHLTDEELYLALGAVDSVGLLYREPEASSGILALCRAFRIPVVANVSGYLGRVTLADGLGTVAEPMNPLSVAQAVTSSFNHAQSARVVGSQYSMGCALNNMYESLRS
jgi:glycosyltransferase involved in cell wall biosynthesis